MKPDVTSYAYQPQLVQYVAALKVTKLAENKTVLVGIRRILTESCLSHFVMLLFMITWGGGLYQIPNGPAVIPSDFLQNIS